MTALHDLSTAMAAIERLKKHKGSLNAKVGELDRQVNDHYHVIELLPLNASELSKVTKNLRSLLKERRDVKEQVIAVSNFLSSVVETAKPCEIHDENASKREQKYTQEALASYEKIFGTKKVLKSV